MLPESVSILSPAGGPGTYTCNVFFVDPNKAKYLNVGDILTDRLGNEYSVDSWAASPSDFGNGTSVTVTFITTDVAPTAFAALGDASIETPGQTDVRPAIRSAGIINTQSVNSGQDFTYNITCGWFVTEDAQNSQIGDHVIDNSGKVFEITVKDNANFTSGTVQEVNKEGISPVLGNASLYRPTNNYEFFQGTELTDPARTLVRNRDDFTIDSALKSLQDQINSGSFSGELISNNYTNNTGSSIDALTAVSTDSSGDLSIIDVSSESSVLGFKGITTNAVPNSTVGSIAKLGLIKDVNTLEALQSALFVAKDGTLTTTAPEIGVNGFIAGDFVIYIGHISKNEDNGSNKDLDLRPKIVGQL